MASRAHDVLVIGGGFIGAATAYHLARRGASVLLLDARHLGGVSSSACAGRAQVAESDLGPHLDLVLLGLARLEGLEAELGLDFEWRRLGNLMLIRRPEHWQPWAERVDHLAGRGVRARMLDAASLREVEPELCTDGILGAAWCLEGHLNPHRFGWAFVRAAQRLGADLRGHEPVTALEHRNGRVTAVRTASGRYGAGAVLVAAGAWSCKVLALAGASLPVCFTNAEAMISERMEPVLHNHVGIADFYETIHNRPRAVAMSVVQVAHGGLYICESVEMADRIRLQCSGWGPRGMACEAQRMFPRLAGARILRAWAGPSPFLPDGEPGIGRMPGWENLYVATCFHLTITTTPVLSEAIAGMMLGDAAALKLEPFNPQRFI